MIRKPIVLNNGQLEQLQVEDKLAPIPHILEVINSETIPILIGATVYIDSANTIKYAKADSIVTKDVIAMCIGDIISEESGIVQVDGLLTLTIEQCDTATGDTGGLTPGSVYVLSAVTMGRITKVAPTAGYVVKIGTAISALDFEISIGTPIKL